MGRAAMTPYGDGTVRDVIFAVPNAGTRGGRKAMLAGARRKAEGVTAGVPDVECYVATAPYHGLHIELKRKDGTPSDVSKAQRDMMARLRAAGRRCEVAYGFEEAWKILTSYLGLGTGT